MQHIKFADLADYGRLRAYTDSHCHSVPAFLVRIRRRELLSAIIIYFHNLKECLFNPFAPAFLFDARLDVLYVYENNIVPETDYSLPRDDKLL